MEVKTILNIYLFLAFSSLINMFKLCNLLHLILVLIITLDKRLTALHLKSQHAITSIEIIQFGFNLIEAGI